MLGDAQRQGWQRQGFLHLPGFVTKEACDGLRTRMDMLLDGFDPAGLATIFSTDDHRHAQDRYFRGSGDKVSFFFEA